MNIWETITGSDLTRDWNGFGDRAKVLPPDYQAAWAEITQHLLLYGDFTGRNLTPIADGVLGLLEESAAEGLTAHQVLGDDIAGFAAAVAGGDGAKTFHDRWREQLNRNVAKKLKHLGG
ncbi:DUF1048 domain-containing protein [Microbacterium ureisolvens]|uniref:DUF1048 domain-containing protein n=1 Tax=Microbacterium ureisolvens TaxID=2781186 RepID=UPI00362C45D6